MSLSNRGVLQHMSAYTKSLDTTYAQTEGITALLEAAGQRWDVLFNLRINSEIYKQPAAFVRVIGQTCVSVCGAAGVCVTWAGAPWL